MEYITDFINFFCKILFNDQSIKMMNELISDMINSKIANV